jgi:hypothetical protein
MSPDPVYPVWKRVVGGACGVGIGIALLLLFRDRGATGEDMRQWQTAIVFAAAAAFVVLLLVKRRK